jgi:hypothetical protein
MPESNPPESDQIKAIKEFMIKELVAKYHDMIRYISSLPFSQATFHHAVVSFDTGILWMKELISNGQMQIDPKKKEIK